MIGPEFLSGIAFATFAASGYFFYKFWIASRDRFFLYFCIACWLLAVERLVLFFVPAPFTGVRTPESEANAWIYLFRLAAFVTIVGGIIQKNRGNKRS